MGDSLGYSHSVLPAASESNISPKLRVPWTRDIVDDRPWLDFALAKGSVRELAHVASATGCVDLIEPGAAGRGGRSRIRFVSIVPSSPQCAPDQDLESAARLFRSSFTPGLRKMYTTVRYFSQEEGSHPRFLQQRGRISAVRHQIRRGQSPPKSPSTIAVTEGDRPLTRTRFTVSATGESHYWPRPGGSHEGNKSGKDLNTKLESPGAVGLVEPGLETTDPDTGAKVVENQLTKFHGIYQRDDRDIRDGHRPRVSNLPVLL